MFTYRTNRKLLLLAVLLLVFAASDFAGPNAMAVVSLDLISDGGDGNRARQGDFDNNGIVEFADFLSFVAVFNASSGDANYNALMDMDGNDVIDFVDRDRAAAGCGQCHGKSIVGINRRRRDAAVQRHGL